MARLSTTERAQLPDSAFAYVDSGGSRRLPIHDASHVRNALARFDSVAFESEEARQRARERLLNAAKKHGIVPVGFITGQLRTNRKHATAGRVVIELAKIQTAEELEQQLRVALADPSLTMHSWSEAEKSWVDRHGSPITLPEALPGQTMTVLHAHGAPSIALLHDAAALGDPDVAEAVTAAIQFVVERQRLATQPSSPPVDIGRLPTGHLTHLLTDIEGSTVLLTHLRDRYAGVLASVRRIIRQEVARAGGFEVDARADETFAVFEDAASAVRAAVEIQRGLAAARWPDGLDVRVRVGLHSGEVSLSEGGYVGLSLNTAARVMTAGHGGQILTTPATVAATAEDLGSIGFRSLGAHRLAGLAEPVELLQVEAEGLADAFPRLRVPAVKASP